MKATPEQIAAVLPLLRAAVFHQAQVWDALRDIESELGQDFEMTETISHYATGCNVPASLEDVTANIDADACAQFLEDIKPDGEPYDAEPIADEVPQ